MSRSGEDETTGARAGSASERPRERNASTRRLGPADFDHGSGLPCRPDRGSPTALRQKGCTMRRTPSLRLQLPYTNCACGCRIAERASRKGVERRSVAVGSVVPPVGPIPIPVAVAADPVIGPVAVIATIVHVLDIEARCEASQTSGTLDWTCCCPCSGEPNSCDEHGSKQGMLHRECFSKSVAREHSRTP